MTRTLGCALCVVLAATVAACGDDSGSATVADGIDLSTADGPLSDSGRVTLEGFDETAVQVTNDAGELLEWCLLLAQQAEQHTRGLMGVTDLGDYPGMLFQFDTDVSGGFWMKDTPTPLSIAYLSADGAIVSTADMAPCVGQDATCPAYNPEGPYRMTVEVPQGELAALGLDGEGARLVRTGSCAPA